MSRSELRVLHIAEAFDPGGVVWWLIDMNEEARKRGVRFDFLALGSGPGMRAGEITDTGSRITVFDASAREIAGGNKFHEAVQRDAYDIVHAHIFNLSGWLLRHAKRAGIPVRIAHFHTTHDARAPSIGTLARRTASRRMLSRYANAVLGCSGSALSSAPTLKTELLRRVVHYGINTQVYSRPALEGPFRAEMKIPQEAPLLGHVGRFHEQKNHRGLIDIFAIVSAQIPEARLILIGDGELFDDIRRLVAERGLEGRVILLGARTDVGELLPEMDVFVFPSLWEGFGIVLLEARMLGIPVVASDIPACREALQGSDGHSLVDPTDVDRFATEVVSRLRRPDPVHPPPAWKDEFSREGSATRLLKAYDDCLRAVEGG